MPKAGCAIYEITAILKLQSCSKAHQHNTNIVHVLWPVKNIKEVLPMKIYYFAMKINASDKSL